MLEQFSSQCLQGKFHLDLGGLSLFLRGWGGGERLDDLEELFRLGLHFLTRKENWTTAIGLAITRRRQAVLWTIVIIRSQRRQKFWDTDSAIDRTICMVVLNLLLNDAHFDLEVLNKHFDGLLVLLAKGNNHIRVLHRRTDEVIIGRFDKPIVLGKNIHNCATTIRNVSFNYRDDHRGGQSVNSEMVCCQSQSEYIYILQVLTNWQKKLKKGKWRERETYFFWLVWCHQGWARKSSSPSGRGISAPQSHECLQRW